MRRGPLAIALSISLTAAACSDSEREREKLGIKPTYDKSTGKLKELTYDSNQNGKVDTWTDMDGARPVQTRIDRNEDGKIDRWEHYDGDPKKVIKFGTRRWSIFGSGLLRPHCFG